MEKTFLFIVWLAAAVVGHAQGGGNQRYVTNQNVWLMYFGSHKFSEKWGVHLEAQLRRSDWLSAPQQALLRTGLNYHFNSQVFATVGYCYVDTSPYGGLPAAAAFPENRIWEQVQARAQHGRFEWVNRLRLEQRLVNVPTPVPGSPGVFEPGDAVYTNRFRLFNRISIPFKGKSITDGVLYLSLYDEVFFNFGKQVAVNALDQNRAYAALGYRIPNLGRLELGYLYQTLYKSDGIKIERNHTLQVGLISNIDFFKEG